MKRLGIFFAALLFASLPLCAAMLLKTAAEPFLSASKLESQCAGVMKDRGQSFEQLSFDDFGDHCRGIYKTDAGRVDVRIENGQVKIQEGLPLCADAKASR